MYVYAHADSIAAESYHLGLVCVCERDILVFFCSLQAFDTVLPCAQAMTLSSVCHICLRGAGRQFTETALGFSMTILNAVIDLVSFSEILYSIYPPLFVALVVYSIGGTGVTLFLGRKLVGLNFQQEAQEANFRCASTPGSQLRAQN